MECWREEGREERSTTGRNQFLLHLDTPSQKTRVVIAWTNKGVAEAVHLRLGCLTDVYTA